MLDVLTDSMDVTTAGAAWRSMRRNLNGSMDRADNMLHDGERCCALLRQLLREVAAFARHQQQRQRQRQYQRQCERRLDGSVVSDELWIEAVTRVCEARLERLQPTTSVMTDEAERRPSAVRPEDVVAEAMVQELLVSLAAIRLAETEAVVLDDVENVESLRQLRTTLQREEAGLRHAVREGAGEDAQLTELQRLLRDEFMQELAQSRAHGLADSLHHEASLQFAWETIQDQKREIVRLRAENAQCKSMEPPLPPQRSDEPLQAIQQLQLQLSSHPHARLRLLEAQLSQLEVAMGQPEGQGQRVVPGQSRSTTAAFGATLSSSRDEVDDASMRGSVLLPSHLATVNASSRRECQQCRRHVRAYVECQAENKQLQAQAIVDEDALVRAEQVHTHMKKEHTGLTSALVAAKQTQEELRQIILEITDEKLRIQSTSESHQRKHAQQVEMLQRQLSELEQWRDRSNRERLDSLTCQQGVENELGRLKKCHATIQIERDLLAKSVEQLEQERNDAKAEAAIEKAKSGEALNALAGTENELRVTKTSLHDAIEQLKVFETTVQQFKRTQHQLLESQATASKQLIQLQEQLRQEATNATRAGDAVNRQSERIGELTRELSSRDAAMRELLDDAAEQQSARQRVDQQLQSSQVTQQRLEQHAAELERRLSQSEETRCVLQHATDQARSRAETLENKTGTVTQELKRSYEECERLKLTLADARAQATSLETQLLDLQRAASKKSVLDAVAQSEFDGVVASTREEAAVEKAKSGEALNALAGTENELRVTKTSLHDAIEQLKVFETTVQQFKRTQHQLLESQATASKQLIQLQEQLRQEATNATRAGDAVNRQSERIGELTRELSSRDAAMRELLDDAAEQQSARQRVDQQLQSSQVTQQRLEQHAAELERRLSQSEETRCVLQHATDQARSRAETLENKTGTVTQELKRSYEECERLKLTLADARAQATSLETQLLDLQRAASKKSVLDAVAQSEFDGVVASTREQNRSLTEELAETKTTILMWMSKYHTAVNGKEKLEEQLESLKDEFANAAIQHNDAMELLGHNLRSLEDDNERILREWASTVEETRTLMSEKECLVETSMQLERQCDELRRRLSGVEERLRAVAAEKEGLEVESANQLITIGALQAAKEPENDHVVTDGKPSDAISLSRKSSQSGEDDVDRTRSTCQLHLNGLPTKDSEFSPSKQLKPSTDGKIGTVSSAVVSALGKSSIVRRASVTVPNRINAKRYPLARLTTPEITALQVDDGCRWGLGSDHRLRCDGQATTVETRLRGLEKERRRLNQRSIAMLEQVIAELQHAKTVRIQLQERLCHQTQSLANAQHYCREVCIENVLLRAFYRWRLTAVSPAAGTGAIPSLGLH